jgi:hypothetical protein
MRYPVPQAAITLNPETQKYGFVVWMPGKKPHYAMVEVFDTQKDALEYIDPHSERVWEAPEADEVSIVAVSKRFKEGSVPTRE